MERPSASRLVLALSASGELAEDLRHLTFSFTVRLTSIDQPQIVGKFTATPGGQFNIFYMIALTSSIIELVNATIK